MFVRRTGVAHASDTFISGDLTDIH
jgi:hypothetical protein